MIAIDWRNNSNEQDVYLLLLFCLIHIKKHIDFWREIKKIPLFSSGYTYNGKREEKKKIQSFIQS